MDFVFVWLYVLDVWEGGLLLVCYLGVMVDVVEIVGVLSDYVYDLCICLVCNIGLGIIV